jgi:Na+/H+ antiporter NhaC
MIITVIILAILGTENSQVPPVFGRIEKLPNLALSLGNFQWLSCLPYVLVLGLASFGINVFTVLVIGILSGGVVGIITLPNYHLITFAQNIFEGYKGMNEILILSLLMGGLGELIKQQGGFNFLTKGLERILLKRKKTTTKAAEAAIGVIASFCDICTANNTIAIILSGETTREIAKQHKISPVRTAILVDLFACAFQGILPYSAQVLMAGSLAKISPLSIIPHVHYCFILGFLGIVAIVFQFPKSSIAYMSRTREMGI